MKEVHRCEGNDRFGLPWVWEVTPRDNVDLGEWGVLENAKLFKDEEFGDYYLVGNLQDCPDERVNGVAVFVLTPHGDPDIHAYGKEAEVWVRENIKR